MGNQQGKAEDIDLAWFAGFMDGEGSFMVISLAGKRLRVMGKEYAQPRIVVVNTDEPTLTTIINILKAHNLPLHISHRECAMNSRGEKWADSWELRVQGFKRCQRWCQALIPFLRTKREQAQAMLELCDRRLSEDVKHMHERPYTERELALIQALRRRPQNPHRLHARTA